MPTKTENSSKSFLKTAMSAQETGSLIAIILMCIVLSLLTPDFLKMTNLLNVARQISVIAIMAVGMCLVCITGEIDLSVGSTFGMTAVVLGTLLLEDFGLFATIIMGMSLATLIGVFNGVLVAKLNMPSFVVTLGSLSIGRGIALTITQGWPKSLYGFVELPNWFWFLGGGRVFGVIPMQAVVMVFVVIIGYFILHKTAIGYQIFAVGGNKRAAELYGISVAKVKIFAFAVAGFLSGLAGLLVLSFVQTAEPNLGTAMELDVIAATVIGGVSLAGGRGSMFGVFLGAVTIGILYNGLVLLGVSPYVQRIMVGLVIIGAVLVSERIVKRR